MQKSPKSNPSPDRNPERAAAELDALLNKGVLADQRATKPPFSASTDTPPFTPTQVRHASPITLSPSVALQQSDVQPQLPKLERLTVRFTLEEARKLEHIRSIARSMGFKVSDTAVFRLALNALDAQKLNPQMIESVLLADGRRR